MMRSFLIIIIVITSSIICSVSSRASMKFNKDGKLKIAQFTDLHFGEGEGTWWGPVQDGNSLAVMDNIIGCESPDMIVFTGDLITGNNIIDNATTYWEMALSPAINASIPWATLFGNHDDLASGVNGTKKDLLTFEMTLPLSLSQIGPSDIHGVSNYIIPIISSTSSSPASYLYIFDSNDICENMTNGDWGCIAEDQVEWYIQQSKINNKGGIIPSLAFFHIPLQEYMDVWNNEVTHGYVNDSIACQTVNTGLFNAFSQMGDVQFVNVGHNHGNDFCGNWTGIELCYGRHTGFGGYGTWERGARIIEITEQPFSIRTWIRYMDCRLETEQIQHNPQPPFITSCNE